MGGQLKVAHVLLIHLLQIVGLAAAAILFI